MKQGLPKRVEIHEVVLRDGIQNEKKLIPTEEKLRLIRELVSCGVRRIEVSSFVNRSLVPQMADAEALWKRIERKKGILYSALILSEGGLERAIRCGVPHVGIFVSASETHSRKNSNKSVSEALKEAVRLIGMAQDAGMKVRAGVMNAFGCAYEGHVPVTRVMKLVRAFMKRGPDEICLADSSGLANPVQMEEGAVAYRREDGRRCRSIASSAQHAGAGVGECLRGARAGGHDLRHVHGRDGRLPLHCRGTGQHRHGRHRRHASFDGTENRDRSRPPCRDEPSLRKGDGTDIPRSTHASQETGLLIRYRQRPLQSIPSVRSVPSFQNKSPFYKGGKRGICLNNHASCLHPSPWSLEKV